MTTVSYQAGRAFVTVVPSFRGFQTAAAAEAKKLRAVKIPVQYDWQDMPATMPTKRPIKVPVEAELSGSFDRDVRSKLAAALKSLPKDIGLKVDASEAEREIASLRTQLETLSKKKIGVDVSADEALAEIAYVRTELDRLGAASSDVQVRADSASAIASLTAVQAMVDRLDADRVNIQADADTARAEEKLRSLRKEKDRAGGSLLITAAVAAAPMAGPLAAVGAGAGAGLAGIGAAGLAGVAGGAAIGMASIKRALDLQKQLTASTKTRATALAGVRTAEAGLATAVRGSSNAQIAAARGVAAAEQGVADARRAGARAIGQAEQGVVDARRSGARAISQAEQGVVDARRSSARSIATAEAGLAEARRNAAQVAVQSEQQITGAEDQLKASQDRVKQSLDALHTAREQAKRDLEDMKERTKDNARTQESADIALIDAQKRLAAAQASSFTTDLEMRKARLDVADAEDAVADAKRQSKRDTEDLQKVEKNGDSGVNSAKGQVAQARKDAAAARAELTQTRKDAAAARADAARGVTKAQTNLSQAQADGARQVSRAEKTLAQTRADAARQVSRAEKTLAQTRADAARSVQRAERNLSQARADGARQMAASSAQVAAAQARVAAAQDKLDKADAKRDKILGRMTPSVKALIAGTKTLKREWNGFLDSVAKPISGAALSGMSAIEKALPGLARFIRPVARGLGDVFKLFGNAAATRGAKQFATDMGRFSGSIIRDAGRGIINLAHGLGNLLRAFMPLSGSMSKGLVNLTKRFAAWSDGLSRNKGFQGFIRYVRKEGPVVTAVLGSIVTIVAKTIAGLAPLGDALLGGLKGPLSFISRLSPKTLGAIATGILAIWAATKLWALAMKAIDFWQDLLIAKAKLMAAAQWLLNAAMDANPIGLVVIAIAALVGGFILAYKKSATFRKIVNGALSAVKDAAQTVVRWFTKHFIPFFTDTIPNAFRATVKWVKKNWPAILAIITGPIGLATLFTTRHWDTITKAFKDAKNWVVTTFKTAWNAVKGVVTTPISDATKVAKGLFGRGGTLRTIFNDVKDWATNTFERSWSAVKGVLLAPIRAARDTISDIFGRGGPIRKAFSNAVTAIGSIWDGLRKAAAVPVNFIIGTVYNNGIRKAINLIPGVKNLPKAKKISFDTGGYTGHGGKYEPAGIVHRGEFVLNKETTARARPVIEALHRSKGRMFGYSQGGSVGGAVFKNPDGRVTVDGHALSRIAAAQLRLAEQVGKINLRVMQGGFGGSHIRASGSSHNYPGVADIAPGSIAVERLLRRVGFAAWARNVPGRSRVGSGAHVHAVSLLDPRDAGAPQVYGSWARHGNGLSGSNNDPAPHYSWISGLRSKLGAMNLSALGGGGGGTNGGGYGGPSVKSILGMMNPAGWLDHLRGMGGFGPVLGSAVKNVVGHAKSFATDKIKALIKTAARALSGGAGASTSGNVREYASTVRQVLIDLGQPASLVGSVLRRMNQESRGNLRAVNHTDSNARAGHPSTGLMQVIRGTYNAYKPHPDSGPYLNGVSINPYSNIYAGLNYAEHRYAKRGGLKYAMDKPGGYDSGGYLPPGLSMVYNGTSKPEPVFTNDQWAEMRKANRVPGGSSNQRPIHIDGTIDPMRVAREVIRQETWAGVS